MCCSATWPKFPTFQLAQGCLAPIYLLFRSKGPDRLIKTCSIEKTLSTNVFARSLGCTSMASVVEVSTHIHS